MMNAVLSILGLAPYLQNAQTIVTVTKDSYEAIKAAKEMLDGPDGQKFKAAIRKAIDAAEAGAKQSVEKGVERVTKSVHPTVEYAAGSYEWDGFEGWVWVPKGAEQ